jgi:TPR repeat protein
MSGSRISEQNCKNPLLQRHLYQFWGEVRNSGADRCGAWGRGCGLFGRQDVGERRGRLYVGTADHVANPDKCGLHEEPLHNWLTIRFRDDNRPYFAKRNEQWRLPCPARSRSGSDLAILEIVLPPPRRFRSVPVVPLGALTAGEEVWPIGLGEEWAPLRRPGVFNRQSPREVEWLDFEGLPSRVGSSGRPVFTRQGLVALTLMDRQETSISTGLRADIIVEKLRGWQLPANLLALPPDPSPRPIASVACDRLAAGPADQTRPAGVPGVPTHRIDAAPAQAACAAAHRAAPEEPRFAYQLGRVYERRGDDAEAARLWGLAAERGHAAAQVDLAGLHFSGRGGLPINEREAARLIGLAAAQGNREAIVGLASLHSAGRGGFRKDERRAVSMIRPLAEEGYPQAQWLLGRFFLEGVGGLRRDEQEGIRLLRLAAAQDRPEAYVDLAMAHDAELGGLRRDEAEILRLLRLAAEQDYPEAQALLGMYHRAGLAGLAKDERVAANLLRRAADQGSTLGWTGLADMYLLGQGGLPRNPAEAVRLFRLAADRDYAPAQRALGVLYLEGAASLPRDEREGVRWLQLAADAGDAIANYLLATVQQQGRGGLPFDFMEVQRRLQAAARGGHAEAQQVLTARGQTW